MPGIADYKLTGWFDLMVPAETLPNIVARLQEETSRAQKHLALTAPIRVVGVEVPNGSGRQYEAHMKNDTKRLT